MEESLYLKIVDTTYRTILRVVDALDPDIVEAVTSTEGVITFVFANGLRCVLNTQRPVRQLWLAVQSTAWHFNWSPTTHQWVDDKGRGDLFQTLQSVILEHGKLEVKFPPRVADTSH